MFPLLLLAASGCDPACDPEVTRYVDADGDGHGDPERASDQCDAPTAGDDCDDGDAARHPGATESCSTPGVDDDCDGLVDDADLDVDGVAELHADADGDGYGSAGVADVGCPVDGLVLDTSDCDDTRASAFPGAPERCDGVDTDCDPATGETGLVTWFPDGADPEDWTNSIAQGDASPTMVELDTPGELDVCEGEWAARFEITAAVRLVAPAGAGLTTIDPAGTGSAVTVRGAEADSVISGFTLRNGSADVGGAVSCSGGANLEIDGAEILNNSARLGGGIASDDCLLYMWDGHLQYNTAEEGGAVWVHQGHFEFNGTPVAYNSATVQGGALRVDARGDYTYTSVSETTIEHNTAPAGAALALSGVAEVQVFATVVDRGGVMANTSGAGGVVTLTGDAMIEFIRADLGEPGTEDDNTPTDVTTLVGDYAFGNDFTTWCRSDGCVEE